MASSILALSLPEGTLLIGFSLNTAPGRPVIDVSAYVFRLRDILSFVDPWRLRTAASAWGVEEFDPRQRTEQRLHDQIGRLVETGRLPVRFLPLFRDDPRGPREEGPLRIYQLDRGAPPATPPPPPPSSPIPPPPPTLTRSATEVENDFPNESAQATTLKRAAKDGKPFCAKCEALRERLEAERAGKGA